MGVGGRESALVVPGGVGPEAKRLLGEREKELRRARAELQNAQRRLRTYREKLQGVDEQNRTLRASAERAASRDATAKEQLSAARQELSEAQRSLRVLNEALQGAQDAQRDAELFSTSMRERYEAAQRTRLRLEADLATRGAELGSTEALLAGKVGEAEAALAELREAKTRLASLSGSSEAAEKASAAREAALVETAEALTARLRRTETELAAARSQLLVREEGLSLLQTKLQETQGRGRVVPFEEYALLRKAHKEVTELAAEKKELENSNEAQAMTLLDCERNVADLRALLRSANEERDRMAADLEVERKNTEKMEERAKAKAAEARRLRQQMLRTEKALAKGHAREAAGLRNGLSVLAQARTDAEETARRESRKSHRQSEKRKALARQLDFAELRAEQAEAQVEEQRAQIALLEGEIATLRHRHLHLRRQSLALAEPGEAASDRCAASNSGRAAEDSILPAGVARDRAGTASSPLGDVPSAPHPAVSAAEALEAAICDFQSGRSANQIARPRAGKSPAVAPIVATRRLAEAAGAALAAVAGHGEAGREIPADPGDWTLKAQDGDVEGHELLSRLGMHAFFASAQREPSHELLGRVAEKFAVVLNAFRQLEAEAAMRIGQTRRSLQLVAATLAQTEEKLVVSRVAEKAETSARQKLALALVSELIRRPLAGCAESAQERPPEGASPSRMPTGDVAAVVHGCTAAPPLAVRLPQCLLDDQCVHGIVHLLMGADDDDLSPQDTDGARDTAAAGGHRSGSLAVQHVTSIVLRGNEVTDVGAHALARLVRASSSLRTLDLRECRVGHRGRRALERALSENCSVIGMRHQEEPGAGGGPVLVGLREAEADAARDFSEAVRRPAEHPGRGPGPRIVVDLRGQEPKRMRYVELCHREGTDLLEAAPDATGQPTPQATATGPRGSAEGAPGAGSASACGRPSVPAPAPLGRPTESAASPVDECEHKGDHGRAPRLGASGSETAALHSPRRAQESRLVGHGGDLGLVPGDPVNTLLFSRIQEMRAMLDDELLRDDAEKARPKRKKRSKSSAGSRPHSRPRSRIDAARRAGNPSREAADLVSHVSQWCARPKTADGAGR